ncbi:MAG: polysaccharide biosynthesis tyrosine autokinase [Candidatus Omnitrophota bacterium]|nr:MAG: polysaccharide biosynthesis tyrosine autokinase [Candidatus Omnitrophota bacterium]
MPQYELNLRDYWRIVRKRKLVILLLFAALTFAALYRASKQVVLYQASCTVKIEERKTIAGLLTEWIVFNPGNIMESETKTIAGFPVMKKVAEYLKAIDENTPVDDMNYVVTRLQSKIEAERVGDTNMIRITATYNEDAGAVRLSNAVAKMYIEENLAEKAKQFRTVRQFIEEQLTTLETRLKDSEEKLRNLGAEGKNFQLAGPIQQKLIDLEFQLAELLQKYTEKHPQVLQLQEQIRQLEFQVKGGSSQELEYARLSREVEVNRKLYSMLKEKLEEARITEAQKVSDVSIVNPAVAAVPISANKNVIIFTGAMMGLILGTALAFLIETFDTSIGTIEDVENLVKLPVLGIVPSVEQAKPKDSAGLIGIIRHAFSRTSETKADDRFVRLHPHYKPSSPNAEAFRNIYTNLKLGPSRKTILITSSGPREGKSSVVCGLGIVMAQSGLKTLIVSTDLRRPTLDKTFGVKREPGVHEYVVGSATLERALRNVTDIMLGDMGLEDVRKTPGFENIWLLTTGKLSSNPSEILASKEMTSLIEKLRAQFDIVIFDAPPVLPVADAGMLASKMDCVVLVYEIGRTSREALIRSKIQLESAGGRMAGIILNHIRPEVEAVSSYPYYYRYKYRYYTAKEPKEEKEKPQRKEKSA